VRKEDDLELLKAERAAADRDYNDALTRLDRAIQRLPAAFPHPPPPLDEHQITPLNTLWKIDAPPAGNDIRGRFVAAVRRAVRPLFEQQQAFNSAVVDHINRNVPIARQTRESIETTLTVLHDQIEGLAAFESLLVIFLQQITPYVDTRDRNVAGLLRGLSSSINAVADELMKRTDALLVREHRHDTRVAELEATVAALQQQIAAIRQAMAGTSDTLSAASPRQGSNREA
jgi:uncharacterized coiled-coil protein SlyX